MLRRARATVVVTALLFSVGAWVTPALAGTSTVTYKDTFSSSTYSGNDGAADFSNGWQEMGENDGPDSGQVLVYEHSFCVSSPCLKFWGTSLDGSNGYGVVRTMDTAEADNIKICFEYRRNLTDDDMSAEVRVEVNNGVDSGWVTIERIPLDRTDGATIHVERDISDLAGAAMQVRFKTYGGQSDIYFFLDDVEIQATWVETATTTTTSTTPPTTTALPATTTTTALPTTTMPPGTPLPPDPTTTTSAPPATTTTTAHPATTTTTTTVAPAVVVPGPADPDARTSRRQDGPMSAQEVADYSSKANMPLDDSMPMLMVPDPDQATADDPSVAGAGHGGLDRIPTQGLMATFSTSTETLGTHSLSVVLLGLLVAWLALRGLGRSRSTRRDSINVT